MSPGQGTLALPRSSVAIWSPLLAHLQALHPTLPLHLVSAITAHLSRAVSSEASSSRTDFTADSVSLDMAVDEPKTDPSYDICLASWAKWLLDNCTSGVADADEAAELRENMVVRIVSALRPDRVDGGASRA